MYKVSNTLFLYYSSVIYDVSMNLHWISDIKISLQDSYLKENKIYRGTTWVGKISQRLEPSKYFSRYNSKCRIWVLRTATKLFFWALNVPEISCENLIAPGLSWHIQKHLCPAGVDYGLTSSLYTPLKEYGNQGLFQPSVLLCLVLPRYPKTPQSEIQWETINVLHSPLA